MSAMEPLCHILSTESQQLSREEILIIEAELFSRLCDELKEMMRSQLRDYFYVMKFSKEKEDKMLDANFIRFILRDLLATEEYTLDGIAQYTNTSSDVVTEVASGQITNPSAVFLRRVIELHRTVRQDLYVAIMRKWSLKYAAG